MKFSIITFGCRVNAAESEQLSLLLQKKGWKNSSPDTANLIIINSCAVTQKAEREARQLVYQLRKKNPLVKVIVTGCSATLWEKEKLKVVGIDFIINNSQKDQLVDLVIQSFEKKSKESLKIGSIDKFVDSGRLMVKVQDGCDYFCSYCIVPFTRRHSKSVPIDKVLKTIQEFQKIKKIKEVILTGINLGLYGKEWKGNLSTLVREVLLKTDVPLISFGSLYVENITLEFLELWQNPQFKKRLTYKFHIPMQSANNKTLLTMKRKYTLEEFDQKVKMLKNSIPSAILATDIIVGYLGETDEDFAKSYLYFKNSVFSRAHIFRFNSRPFTLAKTMQKELFEPTPLQKKQRADKLRKMFKEKMLK